MKGWHENEKCQKNRRVRYVTACHCIFPSNEMIGIIPQINVYPYVNISGATSNDDLIGLWLHMSLIICKIQFELVIQSKAALVGDLLTFIQVRTDAALLLQV